MRVFEEMTFNNIEMYMRTDVFIAFKESIGVTYLPIRHLRIYIFGIRKVSPTSRGRVTLGKRRIG